MLANSLRTNLASNGPFDRNTSTPGQAAMLLSLDGHSRARERHDMRTDPRAHRLPNRPRVDAAGHAVEIYPADIVKRRTMASNGMAGEIVQATKRGKIESRFRAPVHLLAVYDRGVRRDGETFVEGLPRSALRDLRRKLTLCRQVTNIMTARTRTFSRAWLTSISIQPSWQSIRSWVSRRWLRGCFSRMRRYGVRRSS